MSNHEGQQEELIEDFNREMLKIYDAAKTLGYHAAWFKILIDRRGGLGAAQYLLGTDEIQDGFYTLCNLGRMDLTVEYLVTYQKKFASLFTGDELRRAKERLGV